MNDQPALSRRLNLPLLTLFGLGTMVGAGIYVLVGEILAVSGSFAPWAFLLAAVVAGFTAKSYGELASHYRTAPVKPFTWTRRSPARCSPR